MALLEHHQLVEPGVLGLLGDLIRHPRGGRALLGGIGERAEALELRLADEVEQRLELRVRLAGEADDHRRAHEDAALAALAMRLLIQSALPRRFMRLRRLSSMC